MFQMRTLQVLARCHELTRPREKGTLRWRSRMRRLASVWSSSLEYDVSLCSIKLHDLWPSSRILIARQVPTRSLVAMDWHLQVLDVDRYRALASESSTCARGKTVLRVPAGCLKFKTCQGSGLNLRPHFTNPSPQSRVGASMSVAAGSLLILSIYHHYFVICSVRFFEPWSDATSRITVAF